MNTTRTERFTFLEDRRLKPISPHRRWVSPRIVQLSATIAHLGQPFPVARAGFTMGTVGELGVDDFLECVDYPEMFGDGGCNFF